MPGVTGTRAISTRPKQGRGLHHHVEAAVDFQKFVPSGYLHTLFLLACPLAQVPVTVALCKHTFVSSCVEAECGSFLCLAQIEGSACYSCTL